MENNKPVKKIKAGSIDVSVWENSRQINGAPSVVRTVSLQRRYKDANGNWQSSSSLNLNDIPKAMLALGEAYKFMVLRNGNGNGDTEVSDDA